MQKFNVPVKLKMLCAFLRKKENLTCTLYFWYFLYALYHTQTEICLQYISSDFVSCRFLLKVFVVSGFCSGEMSVAVDKGYGLLIMSASLINGCFSSFAVI